MRRALAAAGRGISSHAQRLGDIVIHAPPLSGKLRVKRERKTGPLAVLDLSERASALLRKDSHRVPDVIEELERRGREQSKQVSPSRYAQLEQDLNRSFVAPQLRDYLRHRKIKVSRPSKADLVKAVLASWELEVKQYLTSDEVSKKTLPTTNRDLFFMLGTDGLMMRKWASQCSAQVAIDAYESTITISATSRNIKKFEVRMAQALASVRNRSVSAPILRRYDDERDGPVIMSAIKSFIEKTGDEEVRVSWLGQKDDPFNDAMRYIYASITSARPCTARIYDAQVSRPREVPISNPDMSLFEREKKWTRQGCDVQGNELPEFITASTDTRPSFQMQVPYTSPRPPLTSETQVGRTTATTTTLAEVITGPGDVSFGYVLTSNDATTTFMGNIPGLTRLLKPLEPADVAQETYWKVTYRAHDPFSPTTSTLDHDDETVMEFKIPTRMTGETGPGSVTTTRRRSREREEEDSFFVRLPDRGSDLRLVRHHSSVDVATSDVRDILDTLTHVLVTDPNPKLPQTWTSSSSDDDDDGGTTYWFSKLDLLTDLHFHLPGHPKQDGDNNDNDGRQRRASVVWRKKGGGVLGGKSHELIVRADELRLALPSILHLLNRL